MELTRALGDELTARGNVVERVRDPDALRTLQPRPWDVAFVDILYEPRFDGRQAPEPSTSAAPFVDAGGHSSKTGLDALDWLSSNSPTTKLVLFTTPSGGRSFLVTDAFRRFDIRGAVSKTNEGGVAAALKEVMAGRTFIDDALRPYLPAGHVSTFPLERLFEEPAHRAILLELMKGHRRWKDVAASLGISGDAVQGRVGKMRDLLIEAGHVDPERPLSVGDWVAFVATYTAFVEGETRRAERAAAGRPSKRSRIRRKRGGPDDAGG